MSDGVDDPETAAVIEAVSGIIEILNGVSCAQQALEVLSTTTVLVLCRGFTSAEHADAAYTMFVDIIGKTMQKAESNGHALWTRGTSH